MIVRQALSALEEARDRSLLQSSYCTFHLEADMATEEKGKSIVSVRQDTSRTPFKKLSGGQKVVRICKVIVCILTFGMVFPNINNYD